MVSLSQNAYHQLNLGMSVAFTFLDLMGGWLVDCANIHTVERKNAVFVRFNQTSNSI